MNKTAELIRAYYNAFNQQDKAGFLALLDDRIIHDISQSGREIGKPAFEKFLTHITRCYRENISDLAVMTSADGLRAAAEFTITGEYLHTDGNFPKAHGQKYTLPAGAFFDVRDGKITRISNHYNLKDWLAQVS